MMVGRQVTRCQTRRETSVEEGNRRSSSPNVSNISSSTTISRVEGRSQTERPTNLAAQTAAFSSHCFANNIAICSTSTKLQITSINKDI